MRGLSIRLTAALQASGPLGDSLTKGEMREEEEEVIDALRPHIPTRYDLVKGIVVTPDGRESDPQDIILVDSFTMPPIFGRGHTKAVPVECVVGVIQVKSKATSHAVKRAVANVASAKRLLPPGVRFGFPAGGCDVPRMQQTSATFFGGVLFLSPGTKRDSTVLNAFGGSIREVSPRERCDAVCLLDKFSILWANPSLSVLSNSAEGDPNLNLSFRAEQSEAPLFMGAGENSVLYFYLSLADHLANWITPPIRWLDYASYVPEGGLETRFWYDESGDDVPPWAGT